MNDKELNFRAGLGAFGNENQHIPREVDLDTFDAVGHNEDCLRLLIATGISFTRPADGYVGAEAGMQQPPIVEPIVDGDLLSAARRVAAKVAASWVTDSDVALHRAKTQSARYMQTQTITQSIDDLSN
ncbi:hypothetical protein [Paraburkholderia sp. RL17-373-BIF-A]|uniref:hypothetical protein n=1 Tax=Paraburkholderia sp. RL17-373-BIF-A TaxID=3031629 RepID=UPI0038B8B1FB